ncbi:MAG TPA: hypothetical protein VFN66_08245 [Burkholderiales bacterium]|nr:hypothetical protein [Burkholderiales bacterium]
MITNRFLVAAAASLAACSGFAHAEGMAASIYAGIEEYQWEEYAPSGQQLMKVSGPRVRVGLNIAPPIHSSQFALDYDISMYEGTMNYSSQVSDPNTGAAIPYSSDIAYMGMDTHLDGIYTGFGEQIQPVLMLGFEGWRRSLDSRFITDSAGTTAPAIGYAENWAMVYTKLGARGKAGSFTWLAGLKLPLSVTDTADFLQATTHPKGLLSEYIGGDYTFARTWKIGVNYENTRFGQSDLTGSIAGPNSVYQPKSDEGVFMLSLHKAI